MSTVTMELPDELAAQLTTPEGMARARAAVLAAFGLETDPQERQKQLDREREERLRTRAWRNEPA